MRTPFVIALAIAAIVLLLMATQYAFAQVASQPCCHLSVERLHAGGYVVEKSGSISLISYFLAPTSQRLVLPVEAIEMVREGRGELVTKRSPRFSAIRLKYWQQTLPDF